MRKGARITIITLIFLLFTLSSVNAQSYSIDISGLKSEEYQIGEELNFRIILLEEENKIEREIEIEIHDALSKKIVTKTVMSYQDNVIKIEDDFLGGRWTMKATYGDSSIKRDFSIGENPKVEFIIEDDQLIIKNMGNTRYTKTVEIIIGNVENNYAQNIKVGGEKRLKLISPEGTYNIKVMEPQL
jgi:hypothetical protein